MSPHSKEKNEIASNIYSVYKFNFDSFPSRERIHFARRAYRLTGEEVYAKTIQNWAVSHTIPAIRKTDKILSSVLKGEADYPAVNFPLDASNPRVIKRNKALNRNHALQFYRRYLMNLFQAKIMELDKTLLRSEWPGIVGKLTSIDFDEILINESAVKDVSSFAVNTAFFVSYLEVDKNFFNKFVSFCNNLYFDKNKKVYAQLGRDDYVTFVYNLTHIVIAASKFYQDEVDGFDWIFDYFSNNVDKIVTFCGLDAVAEVGLCFKLSKRKKDYSKSISYIERYVVSKYDDKRMLRDSGLVGKEHTNCVIMLLLSDVDKWCKGPYFDFTPLSDGLLISGSRFKKAIYNNSAVKHSTKKGISSHLASLGYEVADFGRLSFCLNKNGHKTPVCFYQHALTSFMPEVTAKILASKNITRDLLDASGFSVAKGKVFKSDQFLKGKLFASSLSLSVLKPLGAGRGQGVTVGVSNDEDFKAAWDKALKYSKRVLVEQCFEGFHARYTVVGGKCEGVCLQIPPYIVGDGVSSIASLVDKKNKVRDNHPGLINSPIKLTAYRKGFLKSQGFLLQDVLDDGQKVYVDSMSNLATGGESVEIIDVVNDEMLRLAERCASVFPGADVIGIDILSKDHLSAPDDKFNPYIIIEINCKPGFGGHVIPVYGSSVNPLPKVGGAINDNVEKNSDILESFNRENKLPLRCDVNSEHLPDESLSMMIAKAFNALGYSQRLVAGVSIFEKEMQHLLFKGDFGPYYSAIASRAFSNKENFSEVMRRFNIPVYQGKSFSYEDRDMAEEYFSRLNRPLMVPLNSGFTGKYTSDKERSSFLDIWQDCVEKDKKISKKISSGVYIREHSALQKFILGLVVGGQCVGVFHGDNRKEKLLHNECLFSTVDKIPADTIKLIESVSTSATGLDVIEVLVYADDVFNISSGESLSVEDVLAPVHLRDFVLSGLKEGVDVVGSLVKFMDFSASNGRWRFNDD